MSMITIKLGVIYGKHGEVSEIEATKIAKANNFEYTEDFVNQYNGKKLKIDIFSHIVEIQDDQNM